MSKLPHLAALIALVLGLVAPVLMSGEPKKVDADLVAWIPWLSFVFLVGGAVAARRAESTASAVWPGLAAGVTGIACLVAAGMAVGAERQNYWDAWHFASLFWAGALSSVLSLVSLQAARKDSEAAGFGFPLAAMLVLAYVVLVSWMTFPFVQDIEGAIVRWTYLLTHG
jgi:cytochrome bd-type quinol oxidase subunit 2